MWCRCIHHVFELVAKHIIVMVQGPTRMATLDTVQRQQMQRLTIYPLLTEYAFSKDAVQVNRYEWARYMRGRTMATAQGG